MVNLSFNSMSWFGFRRKASAPSSDPISNKTIRSSQTVTEEPLTLFLVHMLAARRR